MSDLADRVLASVQARHAVKACRMCGLHATGSGPVPATFSFHSSIMVVGEAPGRSEDLEGRPFVGKSGGVVRDWLWRAKLNPIDTSYVNVVSCWPNRAPTSDEVAACAPNLQMQMSAASPEYVLVLGGVALQALLPWPVRISELHGLWWRMSLPGSGKSAWATATYHPSACLRNHDLTRPALVDVETFGLVAREGMEGPANRWCARCKTADVDVCWGETMGLCRTCEKLVGMPI